jgi:hypothetical protein
MRLTDSKIRLWLGYTATATGAAFFVLMLAFAVHEFVFLARSSVARAVVIANIPVSSTPETSFCPRFEYRDVDGELHTVTSGACASPPSFTVGQTILVNYRSSNPEDAQTDSFGARWGLPLGFGIAALILLPPGVLLLRRLRMQGDSLDLLSFWD